MAVAMMGMSMQWDWFWFGISLLVCHAALLRISELLSLRKHCASVNLAEGTVTFALHNTKTSFRISGTEHAVIHDSLLARVLWPHLEELQPGDLIYNVSYSYFQKHLACLLKCLAGLTC